MCKLCHFNTFKIWFLWIFVFCTYENWIFTKSTKLRSSKMAKMAVLQLLNPPKLVSRKIWVTPKPWNCVLLRKKIPWSQGTVTVLQKFHEINVFTNKSNLDGNWFHEIQVVQKFCEIYPLHSGFLSLLLKLSCWWDSMAKVILTSLN